MLRLKRAYKTLYKSGLTLGEAKQQLAEQRAECPEIGVLLEFLDTASRGIIR
jgi:UDP-N-acetylglucosamine acyltransferase